MYSSLDTETTGTELIRLKHKPFFVSGCVETGELTTWETPVDPLNREPQWNKSQLKDIQDYADSYSLVFQHGKFDKRALSNVGVSIHRVYDDTLIASHILDNLESHDLKDLAIRYLDLHDDDEQLLKKTVKEALQLYRQLRKSGEIDVDWQCTSEYGPSAWQAWLPKALWDWFGEQDLLDDYVEEHPHFRCAVSDYGGLDASRTIQLWLGFKEEMKKQGLWRQYQMEINTCAAVYEMETRGITLRTKVLDSEYKRYSQMVNDAEREVRRRSSGGDEKLLRSSKQLQALLYDEWGIQPIYRTKTGLSTDAKTLFELEGQPGLSERAKRGLESILEHRQADTARKYLTNYRQSSINGKLYPSYNQTGTKTTRFSHSNPNAANVGKGKDLDDFDEFGNPIKVREFKLRTVFGPAKGRVWFPIDYKQLQLLIFAYACGDESMKESFRKGYDFHKFVAGKIFDKHPGDVTDLEKRIGKNVNFGFIFGASPEKIELTAGMPGLWDTVCECFPTAHGYMRQTINEVRRTGYVYDLSGRKLWIPDSKYYVGVNYLVQSSEGTIVKKAMRDCHTYLESLKDFGFDAFMTMQIHDEICFDFPDDKNSFECISEIALLMERAGRVCRVPTKVSVSYVPFGKSWAEAEELVCDNHQYHLASR